jgi:DUF4097 and DUF4098 domain-containing protein YvlB
MQRSVSNIRNTAPKLKERTMQHFDTTAPVSVVLDIPAGRIRIIAADRADATVEVLPVDPGKGRDVKAAEQVEVSYTDGVLRIQAPEAQNRILGNPGSVEVTVQAPTGSNVEAKAAAAEFRGVGRLGEVAYEAAQGPVEIDEASAVRLALQDGDISVGRLTGPGRVDTAKGDISVGGATRGELVLTTRAGDISVTTAAGVSASLDAGTSSGRIDNALKNDGTTELDIRATTAYGDITAHSL